MSARLRDNHQRRILLVSKKGCTYVLHIYDDIKRLRYALADTWPGSILPHSGYVYLLPKFPERYYGEGASVAYAIDHPYGLLVPSEQNDRFMSLLTGALDGAAFSQEEM